MPVDTHVYRVTGRLGWIDPTITRRAGAPRPRGARPRRDPRRHPRRADPARSRGLQGRPAEVRGLSGLRALSDRPPRARRSGLDPSPRAGAPARNRPRRAVYDHGLGTHRSSLPPKNVCPNHATTPIGDRQGAPRTLIACERRRDTMERNTTSWWSILKAGLVLALSLSAVGIVATGAIFTDSQATAPTRSPPARSILRPLRPRRRWRSATWCRATRSPRRSRSATRARFSTGTPSRARRPMRTGRALRRSST